MDCAVFQKKARGLMDNKIVRFLTALFITAIIVYVAGHFLIWPAVMLMFMFGDGIVPLIILGSIVLVCLVFVGVFKLTGK